jgi:hypothetical protein
MLDIIYENYNIATVIIVNTKRNFGRSEVFVKGKN